jgi:uncharacterized oxidoreductase
MDLAGNTVLVTGGASGIGLAMAERFLQAGSKVIVCGRREGVLRAVQAKYPEVSIRVCDVSKEAERVALLEWATSEFPALNVLVNNAGVQNRFQLAQSPAWEEVREELLINLDAPIHLTLLFMAHLLKQTQPAIINVTSGLAFTPLAYAPIYCSTKAALHSFTLSLRYQLANTPIQVIEVIPPAVNTDLGGSGLHNMGVPLDDFTDSIMQRLAKGDLEIPYGLSEKTSQASRAELDAIFAQRHPPQP